MPALLPAVAELEIERDGDEVTISARTSAANFVFTSSLDGATVLASALSRSTEEPPAARQRFQLQRAKLQVSK